MSRHTPRDRRAVIRRLRASLDDRAADFEMTPAFAERVRRLRRRRRGTRRIATAVTATAALVALAMLALTALWPPERVDFVSPPDVSPSPSASPDIASPSGSETPSPSETRSDPPSAPPSETAAPSEPAGSEPAGPQLTADTPIDLYGIGPVEAGMTIAEAERAAGVDFTVHEAIDPGWRCFHVTADGMEEDFVIMGVSPDGEPLEDPMEGVVARVSSSFDMDSPAETLSGVAIGDPEQEVHDTYPGQITSEPHVYIEGGHYLTFTPRDPADQDFNVKFFTDGEAVREIHAGDVERTGAIEGCA